MKYQCLMIDDDVTIAETTAEYFNIFDIKTAYVTSFEEAVAFLEEHQVSLLLLDINLGERSGFELCKRVRRSTICRFCSSAPARAMMMSSRH